MKLTRPMLAASATNADLDRLQYPLLVSPKLDGIRCIVHPELGPVSRSFKPIPNAYIREILSNSDQGYDYECLDGELMLPSRNFSAITSAVMSHTGTPEDIEFWAFDYLVEPTLPFEERIKPLMEPWFGVPIKVIPVPQIPALNAEMVRHMAAAFIADGYEGVVLRDPKGVYKCGRSTLKQQGMIKYKEFSDAEGTIIGFEELFHNQNPQERDRFGLAERSDRKEGMVGANTLGALVLNTRWGELRVGTGYDSELRREIWGNQAKYLGQLATFKYQPHGMQDLPRFPVFLRIRPQE